MADIPVEQDIRLTAARVAAALRTVLESDLDSLPDLPVGRAPAAAAVPSAPGPQSTAASVECPDKPSPEQLAADVEPPPVLPDDLSSLRVVVAECRRCRLAETRNCTVFGEGPANPILMVVGEGAGPTEDECGRPFAGEAGLMLTNIIRAMGLDRERDCYVTTVLKCRIPDGSTPTPDVIGRCRPYIEKQVALVRPRFILAMGQTAASVLAGSPSITRLRGRFLMAGDTPLVVTYHPSTLLKDPTMKKMVWQDVQLIMERLKCEDAK